MTRFSKRKCCPRRYFQRFNGVNLFETCHKVELSPSSAGLGISFWYDGTMTQRDTKDIELNALGQPVGFPVPNWQPPPRPAREPIQGRYCRLEPLEPDLHAKDLFVANAHDKEGCNWTYLAYPIFETFESYLTWMAENYLADDPLFFAVVDAQTNKAVGVASYLRITPSAGSVEVGHINFSPLLQKTPAATEAMYLMMKYVFDLGYRRYEWKCDALNAPSRAAAQRLGFSYEGIFRQALVYKNRNRDTAWYAIIDKEWPQLGAAFQTWLDPSNFDEKGQQRVRLSELTSGVLVARG
jgi:RimJ/RimL family protein N-acetyltransferase